MKKEILEQLNRWPQPFIKSYALKQILKKEGSAFHSAVKYALKVGDLVRIRRGCYQIAQRKISQFELAQGLHSPSFISFESALSYHGWIPEAVYTTTSSCLKKSVTIPTHLGLFSYTAIPLKGFYTGVEQVTNNGTFLMAKPWRAIADCLHVQNRPFNGLRSLVEDLRIERNDLFEADARLLEELASCYPSLRVKKCLKLLVKQLWR